MSLRSSTVYFASQHMAGRQTFGGRGSPSMAVYVYNTSGEPVGFVLETFIYTQVGDPVGRIIGSRVHRFDGSYVGEWWKEMVVERPEGRPRSLPPIAVPPRRDPPGASFNRRVVLHGGYRDVFHLLAEPSYQHAAE